MIDNKYNLNSLIEDLHSRKDIALFVGAGINASKNLFLSWNNLMDYLFDITLHYVSTERPISADVHAALKKAWTIPKTMNERTNEWSKLYKSAENEFNMLIKASIVKKVLKNGYIPSIQSFLYRQCNKEVLNKAFHEHYNVEQQENDSEPPFHTLYQVAKMIMLTPAIKVVVSYNYDNFLTDAINIMYAEPEFFFKNEELDFVKENRRKVEDISGEQYECNIYNDMVPVYHIHGFIPPPSMPLPKEDNDIVLSLDEFYEVSRNSYSWQTNTPMHYLSHFTCLFAGLSFTDINLQRMIYYAGKSGSNKNKYYYLCANKKNENNNDYAAAEQVLKGLKDMFMNDYGLTLINDNKSYYELYKNLGNIIVDNLKKQKK